MSLNKKNQAGYIENLANAKPSGADHGWSSVPVAKDGVKGPPAIGRMPTPSMAHSTLDTSCVVALVALMRWP
ncbi:MAG TPA: hypothetical protein VMW91_05420 [Desulfosporosinus sp.]|nr:hypothetical protein [Desulfosporosinus sp.]